MSSLALENTENKVVWQPNSAAVPVYLYSLTTACDPSALLRVLEMFALRNLIPDDVRCHTDGDCLTIMVRVRGLAPQMADHLVQRFSNFPIVQSARVCVSHS